MAIKLPDEVAPPPPTRGPAIDISTIVAPPNYKPHTWRSGAPPGAWTHKPAIGSSPDLARILKLPRRPPPTPGSTKDRALTEMMTRRFARPAAACRCREFGRECITRLRSVQAWALYEMGLANGLVAPIGVGHGKTVLDILAPLALRGCKTAVLLVPPNLVTQLMGEYDLISQHFEVPSLVVHGRTFTSLIPGKPVLHVLPYSRLCGAKYTDFLDQLKPDTIIADETHRLRHADTATTSRVLRYWLEHPGTRFCCWSGSITDSSIKDYWHLAKMSLGDGSPLPLDPNIVDDWSRALDPGDNPAPAGSLLEICEPGQSLVEGFHRRLVETPGVVATTEPAVDAELAIQEREAPPLPPAVHDALRTLRASWTRPDGEELVDALSMARCARELACGFYYRWIFPRGEPVADILEWLDARKEWNREVRYKLERREAHLDSPLLLTRAAERAWGDWRRKTPEEIRAEVLADTWVEDEDGRRQMTPEEIETRIAMLTRYEGELPMWKATTWPRWKAAKGSVVPETEAVRLDPFLAQDAAAWGRERRGIVWYEHAAFGQWVAEISGLPLHGGGPDAGQRIGAERGDRSLVASIKSHGTGRDGLQRLFHEQLVANPPSSATAWEQLLGRLHRIGQKAPVVTTEFYRHTPEMRDHVDQALARALYVESTMGSAQKLRLGWKIG